MILRRALRHGKILGTELPFLYKIADTVIENYKGAYPELEQNAERIKSTIKKEEERFKVTLDRGYKLLEDLMQTKDDISGEDAFKLYDTFGFPLELTVEIAEENGKKVDTEGYKVAMQEQKDRAKAATQKISLTDDLVYVNIENKYGSTNFIGYEERESKDSKIVEKVEVENGLTDIILDKTPFYAECGGQVGDTGIIENKNLKAVVLNTFKVNHLSVHRVKVINGEINIGDIVEAKIDKERRQNITIHHSNAHLLQAALVKVLGDEVKQAGSQVEENRTRFDFSFSRAMTKEEIQKVENLINRWIGENYEQRTEVMDIQDAIQSGATALFGEKYEDKVRTVSIGNVSKELCGGTHINSTSEIRLTKIVSESAISAGTRRIEAVCGETAIKWLSEKSEEIDKLSHKFKIPHTEVIEKVEKITEENKELIAELKKLKEEAAKAKIQSFISKAEDIEGGKLFINKIDGFSSEFMKTAIDTIAEKIGESVVVLVSVINENQLSICAKVTDKFVTKGINAGAIVKSIAEATGGRGGGRPNFAQGGGKDITKLDEILQTIRKQIINQ
jgi:alanyl-tRNA synthetase